MKHTLFIAMLTAAAGSQVFAGDTTLTEIQGATYVEAAYGYVGNYGQGEDASGGNVSLLEALEGGDDLSNASVYGGYTRSESKASCYYNTVTMKGGMVGVINGSSTIEGNGGEAHHNSVIMSNGLVNTINGGLADGGNVHDNVIIVSGGRVDSGIRVASSSGEVYDNHLHLVGKGAALTLHDAQGNDVVCQGSAEGLYVGGLNIADAPNAHGNTVDLYGTAISAKRIKNAQIMNFHLEDGMATSNEIILTLTGDTKSYATDLQKVTFGINADAVEDWTAFEGKTITLVQAGWAIAGLDKPQQVNIMKDGKLLTTATLALAGDGKLLQMTVQGVPEPATGTLSLLALAGLCIRRRRK